MRRTRALVPALAAALALLVWLPCTAQATPHAKLTAHFTPDRLGAPTTLSFALRISAGRDVPAPVTTIDLRYPEHLSFATSGLGFATCSPARLEARGPAGCPANSLMGHGSALAEIALESEVVEEPARVTLVAGPTHEEHLDILVYVHGEDPLRAQTIFSAELLPEPPPFGGRLQFEIPLIPLLPEAPDVSIVRLQTTLGPLGLTYYERVHGKTVPYHPTGILLPTTCPRDGFAFAASLAFLNGAHASARATVPCPTHARASR